MTSIKIYGAGSIGNHIAHAARTRDWDVLLTDVDHRALERTRNEIYPGRYGDWDSSIKLGDSREAQNEQADVVFIGTPPDSHIELAARELANNAPRVLMVEKPLCGPDLSGCAALHEQAAGSGTFVGVGYNHVLGKNTQLMEDVIAQNADQEVRTLTAKTREHWGGIFRAHPWISGPEQTYLGFSSRGGGACCEHSHALNLWQHFARMLGAGQVVQISAMLDMRQEGDAFYDQLAAVNLVTERGLAGVVIQDVVTFPTEKSVRVQWSNRFAEWHVNYEAGKDAVVSGNGSNEPAVSLISKTRADDFLLEIDHIEGILTGDITDSPISLERGLDTMMVIAAAFRSAKENRTVTIDWSAGYTPEALKT